MKIGFIGIGSMGSTLVKAFLAAKRCAPDEIVICNRTQSKAEELATDHPGVIVTDSNAKLVQSVNTFFICVKPGEFRHVLEEIKSSVKEDQMAISITSPVMIEDLEEWLPCKIIKIIPSITNQALCGTSLYIPGSRIDAADEEWLHQLLSTISHPLKIDEEYTRIAADLASVAPAFIANILEQLVKVAHERTGLPIEIATPLVEKMAYGVVQLLTSENFTFQSLQKRVAVPGGITAEGLRLLNEELSPIFHRLFQITNDKFREDIVKVKDSLQPV